MKIAIVHEYLLKLGGAERVLKVLSDLYPKADIHTIVYDPKIVAKILKKHKTIKSSFLQNFPLAVKKYPLYLWLMPKAVELLDFSKYDLVISNSHSFVKGIKTTSKTFHICYCHTPTRYLWFNPREHLKRSSFFSGPAKKIIPWFLNWLKKWDYQAAQRPNIIYANSRNVQKRIKKCYNRDSQVLYPPIDWHYWHPTKKPAGFFLYISRLEPHKKPDLAIKAFNKLGLSLKIVGIGSMQERLKDEAKSNIEFLGQVNDQKLRDLYSQAKAVIFPQEEDFGLVPLEAAACGSPTIAYRKGGVLETVINNQTGLFFNRPMVKDLMSAVQKFKRSNFDSKLLRNHAKKFSVQQFQKNINKIVKKYS